MVRSDDLGVTLHLDDSTEHLVWESDLEIHEFTAGTECQTVQCQGCLMGIVREATTLALRPDGEDDWKRNMTAEE